MMRDNSSVWQMSLECVAACTQKGPSCGTDWPPGTQDPMAEACRCMATATIAPSRQAAQTVLGGGPDQVEGLGGRHGCGARSAGVGILGVLGCPQRGLLCGRSRGRGLHTTKVLWLPTLILQMGSAGPRCFRELTFFFANMIMRRGSTQVVLALRCSSHGSCATRVQDGRARAWLERQADAAALLVASTAFPSLMQSFVSVTAAATASALTRAA